MEKPTQKQLDFIRFIEETCYGIDPFMGTTKKEASEYISKNIDNVQLLSEWAIINGYA